MNIKINGITCTCEKGEYLLAIARRNGIIIPTLCHHESLPEQGCCRLCIAEVFERGRGKIIVSCVYPVETECEVETDNEKVRRQRGMILALLRKRAPESREIRMLCEIYKAPEEPRFITVDNEKCIMCGLCARACATLSVGAISTVNRGVLKEIATPYHEPSSVCVGCGSCASVCPTEAIGMTETADSRTIWGRTFPLVRCRSCGRVIGTEPELELAAARSGNDVQVLCDDCRRKAIGKVLALGS